MMGLDKTLKALNDSSRRQILSLLKSGSMNAGQIAEHFEMTSATLSYHLSLLKDAGLIYEEREKNFRIYSLNVSVFEELLAYLYEFKREGVMCEKTNSI